MAVQAEFGESASEAGIRQVEVEPTAPISDVSVWQTNSFSIHLKNLIISYVLGVMQ